MEYTQNMLKVGDWVHTQNGIGIITNVLPKYYQYWEKEYDEAKRLSSWGDDQDVANRIFGEIPEVGDWKKDIITMKRLCNHDIKPLSRTMCFTTPAYANNKITKREMKEVNKILQDQKIRKKFENYTCKYEQTRHLWGIYISPEKAVQIKSALDKLEGNASKNI